MFPAHKGLMSLTLLSCLAAIRCPNSQAGEVSLRDLAASFKDGQKKPVKETAEFINMLNAVANSFTSEEFSKKVAPGVTAEMAYRDPDKYRGEVLRCRGKLIHIYPAERINARTPKNLKHVYLGIMEEKESDRKGQTIYFYLSELPRDPASGKLIEFDRERKSGYEFFTDWVEIECVFLRRYDYPSQWQDSEGRTIIAKSTLMFVKNLKLIENPSHIKPSPAIADGQGIAPTTKEKQESIFLDEIGKQKYPKAPAPESPVTIRFDFSGDKIYAFDYEQTVITVSEMDFLTPSKPNAGRLDAKGFLVLKSEGDGTGMLALKGVHSKWIIDVEEPEKSIERDDPPMFVPDVKEDGSLEGGAANVQPLLKLLSPIPPKPMKKGETAEIPLWIPFNASGSALTVKGSVKITLTEFVKIAGRTCARLDCEIDVSRLDVPKEMKGEYACSMKGAAVYYYDTEIREFISGVTAVLMTLNVEAPMSTPSFKEGASEQPKTTRMNMELDNLIRLTRNEEKAREEAGQKK